MFIEIKNFTKTDSEFIELARIYNLVSHDDLTHADDIKDDWEIRDQKLLRDRLIMYADGKVIGYLGYGQGREENKQKCFFNIFLDPDYDGNGYRQLLYEKMLEEVKAFKCNGLYMSIYDHPNYDETKKILIKNGFKNEFNVRESSLNLSKMNLDTYLPLLEKLDQKGITFHDAKVELSTLANHYVKLEELHWTYSQDFPMPEGIVMTRGSFDHFMKYQKLFEDKRYGIEIIAVDGEKYIGSTDIHIYPKSDPYKAWTGGLGVLREYRRQGIATALKVKALNKLQEKGIKLVRTDNEESNPMYLINVSLGFNPEPYSYEYQKEI